MSAGTFHGGLTLSQMPCDLISDAHEWINEIPPVPTGHPRGYLAISAEELGSAKTRWPRSAPGLDGITVERVIRAPEVALLDEEDGDGP
jgi:hypothetical protein